MIEEENLFFSYSFKRLFIKRLFILAFLFLFYQKIASLAIFDTARSLEPSTSLLGLADDFRTLKWEEVFKYPEAALNQLKELAGRC